MKFNSQKRLNIVRLHFSRSTPKSRSGEKATVRNTLPIFISLLSLMLSMLSASFTLFLENVEVYVKLRPVAPRNSYITVDEPINHQYTSSGIFDDEFEVIFFNSGNKPVAVSYVDYKLSFFSELAAEEMDIVDNSRCTHNRYSSEGKRVVRGRKALSQDIGLLAPLVIKPGDIETRKIKLHAPFWLSDDIVNHHNDSARFGFCLDFEFTTKFLRSDEVRTLVPGGMFKFDFKNNSTTKGYLFFEPGSSIVARRSFLGLIRSFFAMS